MNFGRYVKMTEGLSYRGSGVDIDATDALKRRFSAAVDIGDPRVLNRTGAFASVVDARFPGLDDPVLVLKTDEPGSKQKLAFELGRVDGVCRDLVNHTVNDVVVMGAHPLYVTDCIVGGVLDSSVVAQVVESLAAACEDQGCVLVGGETSIQPGVVTPGVYVLSATVIGVAERSQVIDGRRIISGQILVGLASNGLHTNGYTLVRALLERDPTLAELPLDGERFIDVIMRPHRPYYRALQGLFSTGYLTGLAHITGGGLHDNVVRVLPDDVDATIDLGAIRLLDVFRAVRERGAVAEDDMLRTFNLGVGLVAICPEERLDHVVAHLRGQGVVATPIGRTIEGGGDVSFHGALDW